MHLIPEVADAFDVEEVGVLVGRFVRRELDLGLVLTHRQGTRRFRPTAAHLNDARSADRSPPTPPPPVSSSHCHTQLAMVGVTNPAPPTRCRFRREATSPVSYVTLPVAMRRSIGYAKCPA